MAHYRMLGNGRAQILFAFGGRRYGRTLKVASEREADRAAALVEETIEDLRRGKLALPEDVDPGDFVFTGGKATPTRPPCPAMTLAGLFELYASGLTPGAKEESTRRTEEIHARTLCRILGPTRRVSSIGLGEVQGFADRRAREGVTRVTIRKELATLRVVWGWAHRRRLAPEGPGWSARDVTLPKGVQKPPFATWAEIERAIAPDRPSKAGREALWERLWLDQARTLECLSWVRETSDRPFIHPMMAFAAYTGARRSEILRSLRSDWDFPGGVVAIREKKADAAMGFTRRMVPIHPALGVIMRAWFDRCPGSPWAVGTMDGSPIGPRMATKYLRATLGPGKWRVIHGWHTFRHSLASNMASAGIDQRVIDQVLGHHTEEMARRYAHLHPAGPALAISGMYREADPG